MSSVGDALRRGRLGKGLSLDQISRETKISARLLDAIERDRFDLLPGGVFAKSFVRQYARFLGLDEEELAAEVDKSVNPIVPLPGSVPLAMEPAFKVPRVLDWEGSGRSNSSVLPALAMVVAVMLVCSAVYAWWQGRRRSAPATPAPSVQAAALPAAAKPAPPPVAAPTVNAETTASAATPTTSDAGAAGQPVTNSPSTSALNVSITAAADTWVQAWADGKSVLIGIVGPDVTKTVEASDTIRIRTGNAGDLQLTVNGKPAGPIGPKGQIRIVEVTRSGVQILPPPPKPAPAVPVPDDPL